MNVPSSPPRPLPTGSVIDRLEVSADAPTGVRFVGSSVVPSEGPAYVSWREIHDDARAVGATLQA
ncbi:MAG: hypothetical protein F2562_08430, partial [Actinobacteria bacterium]|nr:hypothetical protein [Actinomycetota bacterium]